MSNEVANENVTEAYTEEYIEIPDRLYFKIGEVSKLTGLKEYVLRYWETEFNVIKPVKSPKGQRVYRKKDIETILMIKRLLYKERYSIEGARLKIKEMRRQGGLTRARKQRIILDESRAEQLKEISSGLKSLIEQCERFQKEIHDTGEQSALPF